jgi:hypothetical protein
MIRKYLSSWTTIGLVAVFLAACGTDQVQPDQDVTLQPGYGIAAVVFDTLDPLNAVSVASRDNKGGQLDIGFVDKGVSLFVYAVPSGSYCLSQFHTGFYRFWTLDPHDDCFDVVAGKVAYSGNFTPRAYGHSVRTAQNYDWPAFEKMFKEKYPKLAHYPIVTP